MHSHYSIDMNNGIIEIFGNNVKLYRTKLNYSQEKLAELSNLHRTYISDLERFQRSISLKNLEKISQALHVPAWKLLYEENT